MSPAMLWPLPAVPVYGAYCFVQRALRTMYWTAATYFYISAVGLDRSGSCSWARRWRS